LFLVCLSTQAYAETVEAITAAMDAADSPAQVAKQAAALEAMTRSKNAPRAAFTQLARADYLIGEDIKDKKTKLSWMDKAIKAADTALAASPGDITALYWRSMACLQKADVVGSLSALGLVKQALKDLDTVSSRDACYDSAGAYRTRGKVLMEAPSWAFIGDKKKGVMLIEKAKAIAPGCLLNRLYLAQAYRVTGRPEDARAEIRYIISAPADKVKPTDDMKVKDEAARLLKDMGGF